MQIRLAQADDVSRLLPLVRQYWEFEQIAGFDAVRIEPVLLRLLAEPRLGRIWVGQSQERLAGYLIAVCMLSVEHQGLMAEVDELFVAAQARSCGLGSQLLAAAEQALAAAGCVRIQLQLGVSNVHARAFYKRRGYTRRAGYELLDKALPGRP
jgi:GNAT superfamily N-acetyltransferase